MHIHEVVTTKLPSPEQARINTMQAQVERSQLLLNKNAYVNSKPNSIKLVRQSHQVLEEYEVIAGQIRRVCSEKCVHVQVRGVSW